MRIAHRTLTTLLVAALVSSISFGGATSAYANQATSPTEDAGIESVVVESDPALPFTETDQAETMPPSAPSEPEASEEETDVDDIAPSSSTPIGADYSATDSNSDSIQPKEIERSVGSSVMSLPLKLEASDSQVIYLNGESGDDAKDGASTESAVKSFDRAKELAKANQGITKILVVGTTNVSGEISLSGTNAILMRERTFKSALLKVIKGAEATLANITIDGNGDDVIAEQALMYVEGGTLKIASGALLQNNKIEGAGDDMPEGGAVHAVNATVIMQDGSITRNQATKGGGIYLKNSDLILSGGSISENIGTHPEKNAFGGGVHADGGSVTITGGIISDNTAEIGSGLFATNTRTSMSGGVISGNTSGEYNGKGGGAYIADSDFTLTGGLITQNAANGFGGGIYYTTSKAANTNFKMSGGSITQNKASKSGGGISFLGKANALITAGLFAENEATGFWGGGAIYNDTNSKLTLHNALITNNQIDEPFLVGAGNKPPSEQGGGIWNCPTGKTTMHITKGLALYDNKANDAGTNKDYYGAGDDFVGMWKYSFGEKEKDGGKPVVIDERMLGGGYRLWYQDGSNQGIHVNFKPSDAEFLPRYDPDNPGSRIAYDVELDTQLNFKSVPTQDSKNLAEQLATVVIRNNKATHAGISGGGIANNGTLVFGEDDTYQLKIHKSWKVDEKTSHPSEIKLKLYVGNHYIEDVVLTEENGWEAIVDNFPNPETLIDVKTGQLLPVHFEEVDSGKYTLIEVSKTTDPETKIYAIELKNEIVGSLNVSKIVKSEEPAKSNSANGKFTFTVELSQPLTGKYGDMDFVDGKATFQLADGESIQADLLPEGVTFTVNEIDVDPSKFEMTSEGNLGTIEANTTSRAIFVNRLIPEPPKPDVPNPKKQPQTGDESPMGMFGLAAILGLALCLASWVRLQRQ